ncbi:AAA domain (dynein-related subfamily) [Peptococcaceae bacterium CEB3]|nr:AAA domain (dynein-related subfamily) [Peptococcaceae bacterium CEB3]
MFDFVSRESVKEKLVEQGYISNKSIEYTLFNTVKLQTPLLIEGAPGVGKTELAKVLSSVFAAKLIRVQCFEGIDFTKVLYDYNYSKQLLYINLLKSNTEKLISDKEFNTAVQIIGDKTDFFGEDFLIERPILEAISPKNHIPKVLLFDEIDKADMEFEAYLLEVLSDFAITIPEYGTIQAAERPLVILTSNSTRELSEALKRRCTYLYIDYPSMEIEAEIIRSKVSIELDFAQRIAEIVNNIRELSLKQKPSIAEAITWAKSLLLIINKDQFDMTNKDEIDLTLNVLLKNKNDIMKVRQSNYLAS